MEPLTRCIGLADRKSETRFSRIDRGAFCSSSAIHDSLRSELREPNVMFLKKCRQTLFSTLPLSPQELETIDEIRTILKDRVRKNTLSDTEILEFALRLLRRDIGGCLEAEVLEELKCEIDYRHWCRRAERSAAADCAPAGPLPGNGGSK